VFDGIEVVGVARSFDATSLLQFFVAAVQASQNMGTNAVLSAKQLPRREELAVRVQV
jgi:hypothetical protein